MRGFVAHAGERVEQFAFVLQWRGVTPLVASSGSFKFARDGDGGLVAMFLVAIVVALQFDEDISLPKMSTSCSTWRRASSCSTRLSCRSLTFAVLLGAHRRAGLRRLR